MTSISSPLVIALVAAGALVVRRRTATLQHARPSRSGSRWLSGRRALRRERSHSFLGYFIFSLVFFPAALMVAYLVSDRTAPALA
jgi:hypothetical protein